MTPPRLARRLLARLAPQDLRATFVDDLDETFARRVATDGPRLARRWYWRQTLTGAWSLSLLHWRRRRRQPLPRRAARPRMDGLLRDLRTGARALMRSPAFTLVAALSLAVGIGVNSAVFSVAEAALLRSWPAQAPWELAQISASRPPGGGEGISYPDYREISTQTTGFAGVVAYARHGALLQSGAGSQLWLDDLVSPNYFDVLGTPPERGRFFSASSLLASEPVVVVSDQFWRRAFDADPSLIGRPIILSGLSYTVLGIAPPHFRGLERAVPTDLWIPASVGEGPRSLEDRGYRDFQLLARLAPGVTPTQAGAQLNAVAGRLADSYPDVDKGRTLTLVSETERLNHAALGTALLLAAVGLVLLICSANVAGLMLARVEARRRELAVRLALGAAPGRLVRQLTVEASLLAAAGAALGLLLAHWLIQLQPALWPPAPFSLGYDLRLDGPVLLFTLGASIVAVLLFGLAPAVGASRLNLVSTLRGVDEVATGSIHRATLRRIVVTGEVALAVVLLTVAALFARSLLSARTLDLGFDASRPLVFFGVSPTTNLNDAGRAAFFDDVEHQVSALPGVARASVARRMLLTGSGGGATRPVSIPGVALPDGQLSLAVKFNAVTPAYFQTIGTRILAGRGFTAADDTSGPRVVIVSQTMAQRFWAEGHAIGGSLIVGGRQATIVGVAEDAKINTVHEPPEPYLYVPLAQAPPGEATLIVLAAGDPQSLVAPVTSVIVRLAHLPSGVRVTVQTMPALRRLAFWSEQTAAAFVGTLGALGLLLAAVGLYTVIAFVVGQRRREIGIRLAIGADRADVLRLVLGDALKLGLTGTAIGLVLAVLSTRVLAGALNGIGPTDPVSFAASAVVAVTVALAASVVPAIRATRVRAVAVLWHG